MSTAAARNGTTAPTPRENPAKLMQRAAPVPIPVQKAFRLLRGTVCAALGLLAAGAQGAGAHGGQYEAGRSTPFARAERMREALEGRPEQQRTRAQYVRVLDAYRAIYHENPASSKADAAVAAVADLLAEEGRVFQDVKSLRDAIAQYEFLRREYPASRFRTSALLTEGEIYERDVGDLTEARTIYGEFLRLYPESPLAAEARAELKSIRREQARAGRGSAPTTRAAAGSGESNSRASTGGEHRRSNTVLDAARASQQTPPRQSTFTEAPGESGANGRTAKQTAGRGMQEDDIPPLLANTQMPPPSAVARNAPTERAAESPAAEDLDAPPPPRRSTLPLVTGVRHWSTTVYTRVAIDLQQEVRYTAARVPGPDRIFFDLYGTRLSPELVGRAVEVTDDGFLSSIRVVQLNNNTVRVALAVNSVSDYAAFFLANPSRLIIDVHGRRGATKPLEVAQQQTIGAGIGIGPVVAQPPRETAPQGTTTGTPTSRSTVSAGYARTGRNGAAPGTHSTSSSLDEVATLNRQPDEVPATKRPTTAPVVASVDGDSDSSEEAPPAPHRVIRTAKPSAARAADDVPPAAAGAPGIVAPATTTQGQAPASMMRALGLKINRIVIDAGHGGHDSGTLGPGGLEEKDVVLDVALRLGALLKSRLGASVVYTRSDDTFIPLETRTAIANQAQADLFISVHANSSPDTGARGVEVYYLNFTNSADALEVAARENASSTESIHQLSDLVKKIALQDKISESRAFAEDVDESLYAGLEEGNAGLRDRGVKKAPFVVLIGANMPSILAEISFLTNPEDAQELRQPRYRERIAEALYRGVSRYVSSMNGMRVAQASTRTGSSE